LDELRARAGDARLELRLHALPDTDVFLIQFVEPQTGEVVREFPPEELAEALADIRQRAASHIDRRA
jgi:uncharacterized FlaG/YvyC family protein